MFGLSWGQIIIIVLVGAFVLGPERIPTTVRWALTGARKIRSFASGAQAELAGELAPEIAELRRQVAELQSLRRLVDPRQLLDLDPGHLVGTRAPRGPEALAAQLRRVPAEPDHLTQTTPVPPPSNRSTP